jgi:outer membrane protein insertion porin family
VRGFKSGTLGPRSTPATGTYASAGQAYYSDRDTDALGGNILITGGAEYLFPVPFIKDNKSVRTSVFWDMGSVYSDKCYLSTTQGCGSVDLSQMASSVGVGVTWYSPLGPLSVNLAYPIARLRMRINRCSSSPWGRRFESTSAGQDVEGRPLQK